MEYEISRKFNSRINLIVPNISWGLMNYEVDVLVVRPSGYCLEFEIKRSFADYKNDFAKHKWKLNGGLDKRIKEFYYVFSSELWHKREGDIKTLLPDFAGVLVIYRDLGNKTYSRIIKSPRRNKNAKPLSKSEMYQVARLGTMRIWTLKRALINLNQKPKS